MCLDLVSFFLVLKCHFILVAVHIEELKAQKKVEAAFTSTQRK